ncbi:hypothetical protein ABW19_dt0203309 [Dactylella cylindrospora]|nr:hypothetical protein ABW19_dt0203309 [Dactylella cylindrospora]
MGDKSAFFDSLYKFDDDSLQDEEVPAEDLQLAELFAAANRSNLQLEYNNQHKEHPPSLQHRRTAPASSTSLSFQNPTSPKVAPPLRRVNTISEPEAIMTKRVREEKAASDAKRKRAKVAKQVLQPIERQVFKDLIFYFIKPDEKRAERKMRMDKAREYGAEVVFEFSDRVTHIIVDKDLKYHEVLKLLDVVVIPGDVVVTNPQWPGDCIKHSKLVKATDFWYHVPGCPEESQLLNPPFEAVESSPVSSSLQVQPRPKGPIETPKSTPPETKTQAQSAPKEKGRESSPINDPKSRSGDELDAIIEECLADGAINVEEFLDDDHEDQTRADSGESSRTDESEDEESSKRQKHKENRKKTGAGTSDWQSHFQCMHKNDGKEGSQNPNSRTIQVLEEMMKAYDDMRDQWRTRSYRQAIGSLKKEKTRYISTYEEAITLPSVGDRLAKKIVEIVTTDRLQRLEYAKLDPSDQILKIFHGIYGVGLVQARKFVAAGYKTLEDVKEHASLTEAQRVGVEHYDDFKQRIPRDEVTEHGQIVAGALKDLDEKIESYIMGSYRRGNKNCGDVDIIITKEGAGVEELHDVLEKLVAKLFEQKFLMCGLAIARHDDGTKWHGASRIGGPDSTKPWRRIDFLIVPGDELGAALLYFTGNDVFNRSMRLLASKKVNAPHKTNIQAYWPNPFV